MTESPNNQPPLNPLNASAPGGSPKKRETLFDFDIPYFDEVQDRPGVQTLMEMAREKVKAEDPALSAGHVEQGAYAVAQRAYMAYKYPGAGDGIEAIKASQRLVELEDPAEIQQQAGKVLSHLDELEKYRIFNRAQLAKQFKPPSRRAGQ